jgi:hypothetical protein
MCNWENDAVKLVVQKPDIKTVLNKFVIFDLTQLMDLPLQNYKMYIEIPQGDFTIVCVAKINFS